jgi:WG containing repeat
MKQTILLFIIFFSGTLLAQPFEIDQNGLVKRKVMNRFSKERGYQLVGTFKKFEGTDNYFALVEKENKRLYIDLNGREFNSFSDVLKYSNIDSINRVKKTSELAIADNAVFSIPSEDVSYSEKWKSRSFKTFIQNGKTGCVFLNDTILKAKFDQILITHFRNDEFLLLKSGGFVGVSNSKGEIVVPIEYNEIYMLQKPTNVFTFYAIKGEKTGVISNKGKITIPFEYPSNTTSWKNLNDFLVIEKKQNGVSVFGIIDGTGKFLTPVIYKEISMFDDKHFLVSIENNGKRYGLINLQGKIISGTDNYAIKTHINNLCIVTNYSIKSGLLDLKTDQLIIPCEYNFEFIVGTNYIEYSKSDNGQPIRGVINANGKIMFESSFQSMFFITNNRLFIAKKDDKFGVIDTTGKIKIPFEYDRINYLPPSNCYNGSLFSFTLNGKMGIVNENAEIFIPAIYDNLSMGEFSVIYKVGNESGVMTLKQKKILTIRDGIIRGESSGIVRWQDSDKRKFKSDFYNHTIENIE